MATTPLSEVSHSPATPTNTLAKMEEAYIEQSLSQAFDKPKALPDSVITLNFLNSTPEQIVSSPDYKNPLWLNEQLKKLPPKERSEKLWSIVDFNNKRNARTFTPSVDQAFYEDFEYLKCGVEEFKKLSADKLNDIFRSHTPLAFSNIPTHIFKSEEFWQAHKEYIEENKEIFLNFVPGFSGVMSALSAAQFIKSYNESFDKNSSAFLHYIYEQLTERYKKLGGKLEKFESTPSASKEPLSNLEISQRLEARYEAEKRHNYAQVKPHISALTLEQLAKDYGNAIKSIYSSSYTDMPHLKAVWTEEIYENLKKYVFTNEYFEHAIKDNYLHTAFYENAQERLSQEKRAQYFTDALEALNVYNPAATHKKNIELIALGIDPIEHKKEQDRLSQSNSYVRGEERQKKDAQKEEKRKSLPSQQNLPYRHPTPKDFLLLFGAPLQSVEYMALIIQHGFTTEFEKLLVSYKIPGLYDLFLKTSQEFLEMPDFASHAFTNTLSKKSNQEQALGSFMCALSQSAIEAIFPSEKELKSYLLQYPFIASSAAQNVAQTPVSPHNLNKVSWLSAALQDEAWCLQILQTQPYFLPVVPLEYINRITDKELVKKVSVNNLALLPGINNELFFTKENLLSAFSSSTKNYQNYKDALDKKWVNALLKKQEDIKTEEFLLDLLAAFKNNHSSANGVQIRSCDILTILATNGTWDKVFDSQPIEKLKTTYQLCLDHWDNQGYSNYSQKIPLFPVRLLSDAAYCVELCKKEAIFDIQAMLADKLVYSRKFSSYMLDVAYQKTKSQDLRVLKQYLHPQMVAFFEKAGIEKNCVDFLKTYFEKKDLFDAINPSAKARYIQVAPQPDQKIASSHTAKNVIAKILTPQEYDPTNITPMRAKKAKKSQLDMKQEIASPVPIAAIQSPEPTKVRKFKL